MKQSDIFTLILIAGIGTLSAFFVCQMLMGDPNDASVKFKTVNRAVSSALIEPDPEVFNSSAINPTVEVFVGGCEDINHNGLLDDFELEACQQETGDDKDDCEDLDGDGELSLEELEACEEKKAEDENGEDDGGEKVPTPDVPNIFDEE